MKIFVHFDRKAIWKRAELREENKQPKVDDLAIAVAAVKALGFKPAYRQPLFVTHGMLIGSSDQIEEIRKVPDVRKVSRTDGQKMTD